MLTACLCTALARIDRRLLPDVSRFFRPLAAAIAPSAIVVVTLNAGIAAPLVAIPVFVGSAFALRAVPPEIIDVLTRRRA